MSGSEVKKLSFSDLQGMVNKRGKIKLKNKSKEKVIFEIEGTNIDGATLDNLRMKVKGNIELRITGEAGVTRMVASKGAQIDAKESVFDKIILRKKDTKADIKEFDIARKHATKNTLIEDGKKVTPFDDGSNYEQNVKAVKYTKAGLYATAGVFTGMAGVGLAMGTAITADATLAIGLSAGGATATTVLPGKSKDEEGNKLMNIRFTIKKPLELKPPKEHNCPDCPEPEVKEVIKYVKVPCPETEQKDDIKPIDNKKPSKDDIETGLKTHVIQNGETPKELASKMPNFEVPKELLRPNCATGNDVIPVGEEVQVRDDVDTSKDKTSKEAKEAFRQSRIEIAKKEAAKLKDANKTQYEVKKGDSYWKIAKETAGTDCKEEIAKQMFLIKYGLNDGKPLKPGAKIITPN